jgi:tetratricopeptide (TPR) repeat protein
MRPLAFLLLLLHAAPLAAQPRVANTLPGEAQSLAAEVEALWGSGEFAAIETRLRRLLELHEAAFGAGGWEASETLGSLCRNGFNARDFAAAERDCRRALVIAEKLRPDAIETARLQGDLAAVLREQGRLAEAEPLIRRSLATRRARLPPGDPWIASGVENLALVIGRQGRLEEALALAEEASAIRTRALGPNHPETLRSADLAAQLRRMIAERRRPAR